MVRNIGPNWTENESIYKAVFLKVTDRLQLNQNNNNEEMPKNSFDSIKFDLE